MFPADGEEGEDWLGSDFRIARISILCISLTRLIGQ